MKRCLEHSMCSNVLIVVYLSFHSERKKESEVAQLCPTLCNPMDCSLPGSSLHGILQARVLEWVAISFSRGSSQLGYQTGVSHIPGRHFNLWAIREAHLSNSEGKVFLVEIETQRQGEEKQGESMSVTSFAYLFSKWWLGPWPSLFQGQRWWPRQSLAWVTSITNSLVLSDRNSTQTSLG